MTTDDDEFDKRLLPLAELQGAGVEALDRLVKHGEPEFITVDGAIRGVLLSPDYYNTMAREFWLARDVAMIRRSMADVEGGRCQPVAELFDELRAKLPAMKVAEDSTPGRPVPHGLK